MLREQRLRHVEELHFGFVRVAHRAAGEKFRGAGNIRKRICQQTAARRFGTREHLLLCAQHIRAHLREGIVTIADKILAEQFSALRGDDL